MKGKVQKDLKYEGIATQPLSWGKVAFFALAWRNYARAIERKRPGSSLSLGRFLFYAFQFCSCYRLGGSVVLGREKDGIFVPSHFCPRTDREGYLLVKKLKDRKVAFFVTPDLGKMLKKLGYYKVPGRIRTEFRGEIVEKEIYLSSKKILPVLAKWLLAYKLQGQEAVALPCPDEDRREEIRDWVEDSPLSSWLERLARDEGDLESWFSTSSWEEEEEDWEEED